MRTFVMGDVHGAWKALKQCLEKVQFDYVNDRLIQLGDVTDGRDDVYDCVEELQAIRNLIAIRGNHDDWFNEFIQTGIHPDQWQQGGTGTARSYLKRMGKEDAIIKTGEGYEVALNPADIPEDHRQFFRRQHLYYIDDKDNCFVHAGFDRKEPFEGQPAETYMWDRELWKQALSFAATKRNSAAKASFKMVTSFNETFIGHTPTSNWQTDQPMHAANVWNMDTGAGHAGKLTIMDIETKQYWQSDPVTELYGPTSS